MHTASMSANPFALLTDPEAIFAAVEAAQRNDALNRRVCRPLDRTPRGEEQGEEAAVAAGEGPAGGTPADAEPSPDRHWG
jgi:hypothetical protein